MDKNERRVDNRLYIGNLDYTITVRDIREIFEKYGEIVAIQIKSGYAFIVSNLY